MIQLLVLSSLLKYFLFNYLVSDEKVENVEKVEEKNEEESKEVVQTKAEETPKAEEVNPETKNVEEDKTKEEKDDTKTSESKTDDKEEKTKKSEDSKVIKNENTKMEEVKGKEKDVLKETKTKSKSTEGTELSEENKSENSSEENETEGTTQESTSNLVDESEEEPQKVECLKSMDLKDVLKINSMNIDFGELFPGQILEETVIILNNLTSTKVPFKIKINCLSKEFDDLDEYVYSMRRPTTQDVFNYNDTFLILLAQKAISYYKLAIKVPNIMEEKQILGNIEISCTECQNGIITIPIKSTIGNLK